MNGGIENKNFYIEIEKMKNEREDQVLFGDFQGENLSPLGPLWVVLVATNLFFALDKGGEI